MTFDRSQIWSRLKQGGKMTSAEVAEIRKRLSLVPIDGDPGRDAENSELLPLLALGQEQNTADQTLVERFLDCSDEDTQCGALKALCEYWHAGMAYFEQLKDFSSVASWRDKPLLCGRAMSSLGGTYFRTKEPSFLFHLHSLALLSERDSSLKRYRNLALRGLLEALVGPVEAFKQWSGDNALKEQIMQQAEKELRRG